MSLTVSRLTAFLAALAMIAVGATFWWAIRTRLEMKAAVTTSRQDRPPPQKLTGRIGRDSRATDTRLSDTRLSDTRLADTRLSDPRATDNRVADTRAGFELAGRSSALPTTPPPAAAPPAAAPPAEDTAGAAPPASRDLDLPEPQFASLPAGGATMPLPSVALLLPSQPDPSPARFTEPPPPPPPPAPVAAAPPPPPPAPEPPRRRPRAAAAPAAAPAAPPPPGPRRPTYYMEKYFEVGEYHYRRRPCEPPNMPDVCFMPQDGREPIVVVSKP